MKIIFNKQVEVAFATIFIVFSMFFTLSCNDFINNTEEQLYLKNNVEQLITTRSNSAEPFYYYFDSKIFIKQRTDKILIRFEAGTKKEQMHTIIERNSGFSQLREFEYYYDSPFGFVAFESNEGEQIPIKFIASILEVSNIVSATYMYERNGLLFGLTEQFIVQLKETSSYEQFETLLKQNECKIVEKCEFTKNRFVLSISKASELDAMQMSCLFYESELFEYATPNRIFFDAYASNDTYFSSQWGLKNTGQSGGKYGIDIKPESAWTLTSGSNSIRIAVLDNGVNMSHEDILPNLVLGYDAELQLPAGGPLSSSDTHGTYCAGIAAAVQNNGKGISGVAPNCTILPIRINGGDFITGVNAVRAINWAVNNGADVISCSWGGSEDADISSAIRNAVSNGRVKNGVPLGCVVIAASGNYNYNYVFYPAAQKNVIAVGAIDRNGNRGTWTGGGSNYGDSLDVVAPGVDIWTTGINTLYSTQTGTSMAVPHVAGVAALILSASPNLTTTQVRKAIESTCQKIATSGYSSNSAHPNGTWINTFGHGLVDAYAAVSAVRTINGPSVLCVNSSGTYTVAFPPSGTYTWSSSSNLTVTGSGSSVSVKGTSAGVGWVRIMSGIIEVARCSVHVGPPSVSVGCPVSSMNAGGSVAFTAFASVGTTSYSWSIIPSNKGTVLSPVGSGEVCKIYFPASAANTFFTITVTASNSCGSTAATKDINVNGYYGEYGEIDASP